MNENKFKKLFKLFYRHGNYVKIKGDNNIVIQNNKPKFVRVYSTNDLPKEPYSFMFWDVVYLEKEQLGLFKKLYEHLSTASEIYYFCHKGGVSCSVNTKKFGWCKLELNFNKMFTEFGIYKSQTRYDINYDYQLNTYPPLYDFISDFIDKARKEYLEDRNL